MQHYHSALSSSSTPTTPADLVSDGVFLRHFLLFIYDICIPISTNNGGADMWAQHLNHLRQIATQRHARLGQERHGYIMWTICELDMYACLMGSGDCEFIRTVLHQQMLPPLEEQIPRTGLAAASPYLADEAHVFPAILALNQGVVIQTAKLAQSAQVFRMGATNIGEDPISPEIYARWQASVSQLQSELFAFWTNNYPDFLGVESPQAGFILPARVRFVFEHVSCTPPHAASNRVEMSTVSILTKVANSQAFALFQAAVIYSRTSMFPGQRLVPVPNQSSVAADTEHRCLSIITLATEILNNQHATDPKSRRRTVFPLFMAGYASSSLDAKRQAINLIRALEASGGIGQNTYGTRQLLNAVCEEQRHAIGEGRGIESVEWLDVARERGLSIVNCGL